MSDPGPERARAVFEDLEAEHRRWCTLISALPDDATGVRIDEKWSAVEALAHVTSWKGNAVALAFGQARADATDPGPTAAPSTLLGIDVDAFNRVTNEQWRDAKACDVLAWAETTHDQLMAILRKLPPDRLLGGSGANGARPWYWMPASSHSLLHRRRLESRLARAGYSLPEGADSMEE